MARFGSEAELAAFLSNLDPDYAQYAPALWPKGVRTPTQLSSFSEPHYLACDVLEAHVDDIKKRAEGPVRQEQHGQQQTLDADAEFFSRLEQSSFLPSASGVGHAPEQFVLLRDRAHILNHRPISHHGVPLALMHEAFGEFVDIFNTGIPTHSDCNLAVDLCKVASEVWTSETKELQPRLHTLFTEYFPGFEVRSAAEFAPEPDERMIYDSMDIGAWELKIDTNGNTYGQIQRYYVAVVQSLQQAKSPVLALSCVSMLYMELSGATLRVCGAATL